MSRRATAGDRAVPAKIIRRRSKPRRLVGDMVHYRSAARIEHHNQLRLIAVGLFLEKILNYFCTKRMISLDKHEKQPMMWPKVANGGRK